jgi:hypothetical protein
MSVHEPARSMRIGVFLLAASFPGRTRANIARLGRDVLPRLRARFGQR